ncbi:MAG: DUF418 domain-containing protein [Cyclobacteriaceae bacterium]|nr:DUF418 domain-containing protein [Cyclobacteriaceae bacterium]
MSNREERIEIIDVLRGFTLLGIILVHFTEQYYAGQPPKIHENYGMHNLADTIMQVIIGIFISGKFFMIFSFLFGLSFFIQLDKSDGSSSFLIRFAWRLICLFLIGMLHHLHYRGDILTIYAVLGFGLLLFYKLPDKVLLVVALLLIFNIPSVAMRLYDAIAVVAPDSMMPPEQKPLEIYYNTLKSGTYFEIVKANWYEFAGKMEFQVVVGRIYITTGLFLLGLYAGRKKWFDQIQIFKKLIRYGLWALLGCVVSAGILALILFVAKIEMTQAMQFLVGGFIYDVFNASLASIYVGLIVLYFQKEKGHQRLMNFYEVGRMGLTTYLMQALIGTLLLFSFGFGLLGDYGAAIWIAVALLVFGLQIVFSKWWLKNFYYGPVEWLWRSMTYLKLQPMKK